MLVWNRTHCLLYNQFQLKRKNNINNVRNDLKSLNYTEILSERTKKFYLLLIHAVPLDPLKPGGQVQSGSWLRTVHSAVFSQGFSIAHGS